MRRRLPLMMMFPLALALAMLLAACAQSPSSPSPSPSAAGSLDLVGDARNSCPSDAPGSFSVSDGELVGARWKNYIRFEPVASSNGGFTPQYLVELVRRQPNQGPSVPAGSWTLTVTGAGARFSEFERYDLPAGIYGATIRSYCGSVLQGNRSPQVQFVNGDSPFGPDVPKPAPVPTAPQTPEACVPAALHEC
jgi:hypothetical protein